MAESPVETVKSPDTKGNLVVVAVDGSEYSDYALEFYVEKVHKPDNHVILVHVVKTKSVTSPEIERTHGDAGPAIVSVAIRNKADFVVIGCCGKGTVRRTLTGSVTDYVTHHSHVPIIITRHIDRIKSYHGFKSKPVNRDKKQKHKDGKGHRDEAEPQDDKGI